MQPWKISAGLTAAIAGSAILLAGPRLEYLAPYWPLLLAEHGVLLAVQSAVHVHTSPRPWCFSSFGTLRSLAPQNDQISSHCTRSDSTSLTRASCRSMQYVPTFLSNRETVFLDVPVRRDVARILFPSTSAFRIMARFSSLSLFICVS